MLANGDSRVGPTVGASSAGVENTSKIEVGPDAASALLGLAGGPALGGTLP